MKAIVYTEFGPPEVLQLKEVEKPSPKKGEVLIKIYAAAVAKEDPEMRASPVLMVSGIQKKLYWGVISPEKSKWSEIAYKDSGKATRFLDLPFLELGLMPSIYVCLEKGRWQLNRSI